MNSKLFDGPLSTFPCNYSSAITKYFNILLISKKPSTSKSGQLMDRIIWYNNRFVDNGTEPVS